MTWLPRIFGAVLLTALASCGDDGDHSDFIPDWTAWTCSADDAGDKAADGGSLDASVPEDDAGASDRSCDPSANRWVITLHSDDGGACVCDIGLDESFEVALEPCDDGHYASRMFVAKNNDERCRDLGSKGGQRHDELVEVSPDGCTVHYRYARPWTNSSEEGLIHYDLTWTTDGSKDNVTARVEGTGFCHERLDLSATVEPLRQTM